MRSSRAKDNPRSETVLARLSEPSVDEPTTIAVVADPHVTPRAEGTAMVYHRSGERLRTALADAEARGVDAIVSAGDLTKDGAPWEYEFLDGILADVETRFFSVPGNHDVPKASTEEYEHGDVHETPPVKRFEKEYTPDGRLPFVERVGGIDIVGLDTASMPDGSLAETHDGQVSPAQVQWLDSTLEDVEEPLVLMHHNTPAMFEQFATLREQSHPKMTDPPVLRDPQPLLDTLTDHEVPLVVTGHLHNLGVAETGPVREVTTPATGSFPQAYLLFELGPSGTTVRYVPVTDTEGNTEAHHLRRTSGPRGKGYAAFASVRLATMPLLDEQK
jgi:DNA repair exonuclease SbcCD nuclease subunit